MFKGFFKAPNGTVETRKSGKMTVYVDQKGIEAESAYQSQAHASIEDLTNKFDDFKKRRFTVDKGFALGNSLSKEEQCALLNLGKKDIEITGQSIIDAISKTHTEFTKMLNMGCAWFAEDLQILENIAKNLPSLLDSLVAKKALKEESPQETNTVRP